jgi:large subunit ribosomal protein L22
MNKVQEDTKIQTEEKKEEKVEEKTTIKKEEKKTVIKEKAVAFGNSLRVSPKNCMAICKVIRGKSPQEAIKRLDDVLKMKRVIPMEHREVPHKKGRGISGASYPLNACKAMIEILKQLEANASINGIENPIISLAIANIASRPFRRGGTRAKRAHIRLEAINKSKKAIKK